MNLMYDKTKQTPFNIIDNVFYVGTKFVSSHLFTSKEGHILIDACMPGDGPIILDNIKELGFDPCDMHKLDVDVWLGAHPFFNETFEKYEWSKKTIKISTHTLTRKVEKSFSTDG